MPTLLKGCLEDICVLMFKVKHNLCPAYISHIFSEHNSTYNLFFFFFRTCYLFTIIFCITNNCYINYEKKYIQTKLKGKRRKPDK